jgi:tetratricopeptide (TPR) repeat protein
MKITVALCAACLVIALGNNLHAEPASALVRLKDAPLHARPDDASPVIVTLQPGTGLSLAAPCVADQAWCNVTARNRDTRGSLVTGWMRAAVMFPSAGIRTYLETSHSADAASLLRNEIRTVGDDPLVGSWLRFYLSVAREELDQLDNASQSLQNEAAQSLEEVIRLGKENVFVPFAYLALAKLHLRHSDVAGALRVYEAMVSAFPDYAIDFAACYASPVVVKVAVCSGDRVIQKRIDATRRFLGRKLNAERVIASVPAPAPEVAAAWYDLGQAWEEKDEIDPDRLGVAQTVDVSDARRCYEAAVTSAPGSDVAGKAAWRLIDFSHPYEWDGDWQGRADWMLEQYGVFVNTYPDHEYTGEALFKMGVATWVKAGYPELYHYIIVPEGFGTAWQAKKTALEQWFDTGGFGGGKGELVAQHPEQTLDARRMFQDVVSRFPQTQSAAMAKFYIAVISDYCLKDTKAALSEYGDFVRQYPRATPYIDKAKQRIALLR